ncbi:methyltransferase domain-containing protein [bacterium]|nr:methyltransferase domain-containing protein [bacterium]
MAHLSKPKPKPKPRVEVSGFSARHYDLLMDLITFGLYPSFIEKAVSLIAIKPEDKILDFGSGTGRNDCLMAKRLSGRGKIVGIDISDEMINQFKKKCRNIKNAYVFNQRIDKPMPYKEEFNKVFISFVLHGFCQKAREAIIDNAFKALESKGEFFILDYNEFSLDSVGFFQRNIFKLIECPYAFDFIKRDWKEILSQKGFCNFEEYFFFGKFVRLLKAEKR